MTRFNYNFLPLLASLRTGSSRLTYQDKVILATQLLTVLNDYYVHLALKTSALAIDPLQEAKLLLDDLRFIQIDSDFFRRILEIVKEITRPTYRIPPSTALDGDGRGLAVQTRLVLGGPTPDGLGRQCFLRCG